MARLFVAIEVPAVLADALLARVPRVAGVRLAAPHQVHLTLHFLGERDEDTAVCIEQALQAVSCTPFALSVQQAGCFRGRRASVLWAGVARCVALDALHAAVEDALAGCDGDAGAQSPAPPSTHRRHAGFLPHITLARSMQAVPDNALRAWRAAQMDQVGEPFTVERFVLYQSYLRPGGAQHVCRRAYALAVTG
ncbi:RNA 2',3'-cyclic phosphodiesterase [Cupriavidus sp. 2TAF22]|uniref:RNA 2',3'-cyclic phosphodiesterase n=1 Tax=unclassified Cupriavidus TaxID=2640874 RepID=UPI003F926DED